MTTVVTWVVLANARSVRVLANMGPGSGLCAVQDSQWNAETPARCDVDQGVSSADMQPLRHKEDVRLARQVAHDLLESFEREAFDRLVLVSGPHMMGLLRATLTPPLHAATLGWITRDFSVLPLAALEPHLGEMIEM